MEADQWKALLFEILALGSCGRWEKLPATDWLIDQVVYGLCGVTEGEIAVVEVT